MFNKMKELMEFKKQADVLKRELDAATITNTDVPGITITITGSQVFRSIEIQEGLAESHNKNKLESDIVRACNGAVQQAQRLATQKMQSATGLNLPGF